MVPSAHDNEPGQRAPPHPQVSSVPCPAEPVPGATGPAKVERHASWLELFFDLIAVAGVAQLASLLRGAPGHGEVLLYCLLYLAFWTAWGCAS
ncbi:low temperature requirement protein A [Streptomyces sp. NPDC046161]|uniref:low temperature requirement protein A n=1 Tax=Streptomyces sp. NPDC046161 TaxID=3155132 RepID=UPI0033C60155